MKFLAFFVFSILSFQNIFAADSVKIISMNAYMLPWLVKPSMQERRTDAILEQLKNTNYDLIFFQEAFTNQFRDTLTKNLNQTYPHSFYLDKDNKFFSFLGSGLFVLSRHPFKVLDQVYFKDCASFDCFSSKGSLLIEVSYPGNKVYQFAVTHLQAGQQKSAIRMTQLAQIKESLTRHKGHSLAQFLVGDLNIDAASEDFLNALVLLNMKNANLVGAVKTTNARINDCYSTGEKKMWIDHILINNSAIVQNPEMQVVDFSFKDNEKTCPSSDHHALEANFNMTQENKLSTTLNLKEEKTFFENLKIKFINFGHEHSSSGPNEAFSATVGVYSFVISDKNSSEEITVYTDTTGRSNPVKWKGYSIEMTSATGDQKTVTLSLSKGI